MTNIASMIKKIQAESDSKTKKTTRTKVEKADAGKVKNVEKKKQPTVVKKGSPSEPLNEEDPRKDIEEAKIPNPSVRSEVENLAFLENIQEYALSDEVKRFTYILEKKNWDILNTIKNETGVPITNLINHFISEMINANNKEITKLIRKQYQNLKL